MPRRTHAFDRDQGRKKVDPEVKYRRILITIEPTLLKRIDQIAKVSGTSRSEWLSKAAAWYMPFGGLRQPVSNDQIIINLNNLAHQQSNEIIALSNKHYKLLEWAMEVCKFLRLEDGEEAQDLYARSPIDSK